MITYISLLNFTNEGIRKIKDSPKWARSFQAMAKKAGVKVREIYWTMGRYDIVVIAEARNEETIMRVLYGLGSLGNVQTETLRAFSGNEVGRILRKMP